MKRSILEIFMSVIHVPIMDLRISHDDDIISSNVSLMQGDEHERKELRMLVNLP